MMLLNISKTLCKLCLLIGLFTSIHLVTNQYRYSWSMTATQKLSPTTLSLLEKISKPIEIDLYSNDVDNYRQAQFLITQYQSAKPNIMLHWNNKPYSFSNDYQSAALLVKIDGHQEVIDLLKNPLNEQALSQSLFKLCNKANEWIVFLQGHNEPSPFNVQATDYSLLRVALQNQGFQTQTLSLINTPLIADNTRLLIIAAPKNNLLPEEEKLILQYLLQGGNLLWLIDNNMHPLPFLSEFFQVTPLPGTIVDLHGYRLGTPHPAITIIDNYPQSPFATPKSLTAFPYAVALKSSPLANWSSQSLLVTHEQTWTETDSLIESIAFEPEKNEVAGP
ncbi:MAG TPA: Gldg family protein, partial [Candidatus Berkiella sp.]|nr:Gldg family protein [Candidatus Berkiella sp.]